ncbi:MAG TPA: DUF4105 domain-containing protein [Parafilimonas sp.]|nr:DUF4105 domain-containing protein [Parafilimonas sp.]
MKQFFVILFLLIFSTSIPAQNNINHTRISIITCGPGDELYSLFGHTALRIIDSTAHQDVVYNWGGFTFDPPIFYLKFMRGKLLYYSFADNFPDFMAEYVYEHRSVYEQVLDLDSASKQKVLDAVMYNTEGDNRFYKYDFLLDNCTTRVRNIVFENNKDAIIKSKIVPDKTTSRDMIHYYLERGSKPWTELGIDILLGGRVDRTVSNNEAMFMPEFLMKGLAEANKQDTAFVKNTRILSQEEAQQTNSGKFLPLIILTIISMVVFIISRSKAAWAKVLTSFVDALLLYVTGLIGILLLFMWFGTDHTVCENNFNLAWTLPFNLPVAFFLTKKPGWLSNYFFIAVVITAVLLAAWFWLPQQMNIALLPVVILLLNRYVNLANKYRRIA